MLPTVTVITRMLALAGAASARARHLEARLRRPGPLVGETHAAGTSPVAILHAVQRDLVQRDSLLDTCTVPSRAAHHLL